MGSTIGFCSLGVEGFRGRMRWRQGCGWWGRQPFGDLLGSEVPPLPLGSSRGVHRDDAGQKRLWLCSVDEMAWMSSSCKEVQRWDPTFVSVWM